MARYIKKSVSSENHDNKGRFTKGNNANPKGNNQFTSIVPLLEALERKGIERDESFWDMVAGKCWTSDQILIAVLKKIVPDKLEHDLTDNLLEKYREVPIAELINKLNAIIGKSKS